MPNETSELVLVFGPADDALSDSLTHAGGFSAVRFCGTREEAAAVLSEATPMLILVGGPTSPELAGFLESLREREELASVPVLDVEDVRPMLEGRGAAGLR